MRYSVDFSDVKKESYAEIGQARPCTFAFAFVRDNVVFPQHQLVKCRDFLNDTLVWDEEKTKGRIWGYTFAGPYEKNKTSLYMEDAAAMPKNLHLLNAFEDELGVSHTKVFDCGDKGHLIEGDSFWQLTTIHLSWYTQVLRWLTYPDLAGRSDTRSEVMMNTKGFWDLPKQLKNYKITIKRNAPAISGMHDHNGFYTFLTNKYIRSKLTYGQQFKESV